MDRSALRQRFMDTAGGVGAELRLLSMRGDRARLCAETVASVVLAVYLADVFHLEERWWVALSAYVLTKADLPAVLRRCLERLAGTVTGAMCGAWVAAVVRHDVWSFTLVIACIAGIGIYCMLGSRYAYSWILGTVTALMVVGDPLGSVSPTSLAINRVLDVAVGILSTATVCALSFFIRRVLHAMGSSGGISPAMERNEQTHAPLPIARARSVRVWQAGQGALAIAVIGLIDRVHALPNAAQSMVSVIAVLLVPLSVLMEGRAEQAVLGRMVNRFLGCLCAAFLAAPLLPLIGDMPLLCLAVLGAGVWLAAHVQAGSPEASYIGTQFGVGFIMIFVQDHAWSTDPSAAWHRLMGIIVALLVLAATMAAGSMMRKRVRLT